MGCFISRLAPAVVIFLAGLFSASPAPAVTVAAPADGAVLGDPGNIVSGRAGGKKIWARLNGRDLPDAIVRNGFFSFTVVLAPGVNRLGLRSSTGSAEITLEYRAGGTGYRFHPGYATGECRDCHAGSIGTIGTPTESDLCHSCHDSKDGARYLHGPVGAGQCASCHDPHGSAEKAFLARAGTDLCEACHDQPGSRKHMDNSQGKNCIACHNPHGSEKKFFLY